MLNPELYPEIFSLMIPGIPRLLTALAEWSAVVSTVFLMNRRFFLPRTLAFLAGTLPVQILLRCGYTGYMIRPVFAAVMFFNLAFMMLCITVLTREGLFNVIMAWAFAFLTAEFSASFVWQLFCICLKSPSLAEIPVILAAFLSLGSINLGYWFFIHNNEDGIQTNEQNSALIAVGVCLLVFMAGNINVFRESLWFEGNAPDVSEMIGWIRTIVDFCGLILLWLVLRIDRERKMKNEMDAMERLMDAQYRQYVSFRENSDFIRRQCHDLRHQVRFLKKGFPEEDKAGYFADIEDAINRYQTHVDTGNTVLDTILTQYQMRFHEKNIRFEYMAKGDALKNIEARDICTIFGNLLENAEEAVKGLAPEDRLIRMNVDTRKQFITIHVENRFDGIISWREGLPVTTKKDDRMHGIGVSSVKYTVRKYNGEIQFDRKEGWFTAAILIPVSETAVGNS